MTPIFSKNDKAILRDLLKMKLEIANFPIMAERKRLWHKQKSLQSERTMILLESGSVNKDELPFFADMICESSWARGMEWRLRHEIYHFTEVGDDSVVSPWLNIGWQVSSSDYGVEVKKERGIDIKGHSVGFHWEPPIKDLEKEIHKLKHRTHTVDKEDALSRKAFLEEEFGDIMPVRMHGSLWWTFGLTWQVIDLIGLDMMMIYMYEQPEALKQLIDLLMKDHLEFAKWAEKNGVLSLNNENDNVGSGTLGFTDELPADDWKTGDDVRTQDMWLLLESQETVGISPAMYNEFIYPFHAELAKHFGLIYYGCCEPVHDRWEYIKQIPNLRAVSISPWCNENFMAAALGENYVYSRKPAPASISSFSVDMDVINKDLINTAGLIRQYKCNGEIIMKDLHTVNGEPQRMKQWVDAARNAIG